ncbi:MAG: hypothetical protein JWN07_2778 [Hyphomicrobiales bacterium]|nr:hypothetical protein [Hyphomicrobiales bacterium]
MIRLVIFAAAFAIPAACLCAEIEVSALDQRAAVVDEDRTATIPSAGGLQTFDPTSAFDGYWFPQRALDGQEDR